MAGRRAGRRTSRGKGKRNRGAGTASQRVRERRVTSWEVSRSSKATADQEKRCKEALEQVPVVERTASGIPRLPSTVPPYVPEMPTLPAPVSLPADPSRGRLAGKTCALFGAGQSPGEPGFLGNGRATVMRMAQEGCRVLAVDSDPASAEETARLANAQPGLPLKDPVVAYKADVAEESEVKAALDEVVRRWGTLSIVHYNVGVSVGAGDGPLAAMTRDRFEKVSRVNLWGLVAAAKHAAEIMGKQEGGGVICSISSAAAVENSYPNVVYRLTKSAIVSFTSSQALQLAPRLIRVNTVLPGLIDTPMAVDTRARVLNRPRADVQAERDRRVPLGGKQGSPWDVANAVVWLCSDEARWVTGQALGVCGGGTLGRL